MRAPTTTGPAWIRLRASPALTNNCSDALAVNVVAPDLLVGTLTLEGDDPGVGTSFTLQALVLNQGGAESGATTVRYYRGRTMPRSPLPTRKW